jgi:hypothetical protein
MPAMGEITNRLEEFKKSGFIADYELVVVDDSIRIRVIAPRSQEPSSVKAFVVESMAGLVSDSQVSVEAEAA